ncbi:exonuclease 1-like isoform X1 [Homalodisca vitripennis]|uniref:exonuclease 1-like isoform X1 n=1 Tax=Homalodisca vitripennis TaxID=197043 RepID=UPI001EE9E535|nr:exonuclease 1-like isoform X1 [Homalodisca vitripennis]
MAVELMRECRARNVDCITAPYEADAQLAYLNLAGIAHIIITEDSDLLLFGCTKVIFKLDLSGNGLLVEQERLHLAMGISPSSFSLDRFRHMCILSGCDYLPSLPKIGLGKACRFIKSTVDPDIHRALSRLGGHLNMNIVVPLEYRDKFMEADAMFRHQPVFDPLRKKLVPLTPPAPGAPPPPLLSQEPLDETQLLQLALGNLDPFTLTKVDDWSPDKPMKAEGRSNGWNARLIAPHKSIWSADYKPQPVVTQQPDPCQVTRSSTSGRIVEKSVEIPKLSAKRPSQTTEEELNSIRSQFGISPQPTKKPRQNAEDILDLLDKTDHTPPRSDETQSQLLESPRKTNPNPFTKTTPSSANKFSGLSKTSSVQADSCQWIKCTEQIF